MPYAPIRLFLCKSQTMSSPLCVGGSGGGGQYGGGGGGGGGDYGGGGAIAILQLYQTSHTYV